MSLVSICVQYEVVIIYHWNTDGITSFRFNETIKFDDDDDDDGDDDLWRINL